MTPANPTATHEGRGTFDLTGPLPTGTTVLEASAGTGKTYTIAGLVTRFVAEGVARVDELLVVTFGRAATAELRDRVRGRMVTARDALEDPATARTSPDEVVALLAQGDPQQVAARRDRLAAALASFDGATVATIHQFCQQVLTSLGTAADVDPTASLVEDFSDLVEEVCDDLYVRFSIRPGAPPLPFGRQVALRIAREAVNRADAVLEPRGSAPDTPEDLRVRFAAGVRREVAARKRSRRAVGFDDLLIVLRDALTAPVAGEVACDRLRRRYSVVLVDEFQDTDAVQWEILQRAFHGVCPLVLIGDPKQAIYAFRGADVSSYLAAVDVAGRTATLGTNHRSDPRVLRGVHALLRGAALGDERIVVRDVEPFRDAAALLWQGIADTAPVRLRVVTRDGLPVTARTGVPVVSDVRARVVTDVGAQVVGVLAEGLVVRERGTGPERPLRAGDVAVLVRTQAQANAVQTELRRRGVPCVLSRGPSVFATPAARDWVTLLEAVEQPHRVQRVRRLAVSSLVGTSVADLDSAGEASTDALTAQLRTWGAVLADRGVAGLFAAVDESHRLAARLLAVEGGERLLTDLRHIAESLHAVATAGGTGLAGLLTWLRSRVAEADADVDQERSRRLDTDREAVQVATVHTSKGLEFGVVCVPFGWDSVGGGSRDRLPVAHDTAPAARREAGAPPPRALHVGGPAAARYDEFCRLADAEDAGEELRLFYVAVTRAVSRLLVWWAPGTTTQRGALHRLLFADDPAAVPDKVALPTDAALTQRLVAVLGEDLGVSSGIVCETVPVQADERAHTPGGTGGTALTVAAFGAQVDAGWRRTSYSGLTRAVHETAHAPGAAVTSEPESTGTVDEVDLSAGPAVGVPGQDTDPREAWRLVPSPMADLPAGAGFGTLVHAVLEHFDPAVPDRTAHLAALAREQFAGALAEPLSTALQPALRTGLGPLAGGTALDDHAARDRLNELDFELPLAGGDEADGVGPRLGDVVPLLRRHLPAGDPVLRYADLLAEPVLAAESLRGYLTGSIDAVLRHRPAGAAEPAYLVVDYKTNRLGGPGEPLTAWHYRSEALDDAVLAAHYPLQALLYCVALHRFLRWRHPGYDPHTHLGGVLYLFLRGMCGPAPAVDPDQAPPGVWSWKPPAALVVDLSDLLAGRLS